MKRFQLPSLECSKNEIFDHSSNICFSLIPYLAILIVRIRDLNFFIISFFVYHLINQTIFRLYIVYIY